MQILKQAAGLIERTLGDAQTGFALLDLDGTVMTCNPAFADLACRSATKVSRRKIADVLDPSVREVFIERLSKFQDDEASVTVLSKVTTEYGLALSVNLNPILDDADQAIALMITVEDLGAGFSQKDGDKAEEVVAQTAFAAARLERLTENMPGGIYEFVVDAEGKMSFPYATSNVGPLLGTTSDLLRADASVGFAKIHPEDLPTFQAAILESQETLMLFKMVIRIVHPDQGIRWLRVTSTPASRAEGGVIWYGNLFDVTDEVESEQAAKAAAERAKTATARLERMTENVPGGMFEFKMDADGTAFFPYVNPAMAPLLGTTSDAIRADASAAFTNDHPDDAQRIHAAIETSRTTLEPVKITHRLIHPEKGLRWHRINASASKGPDGSVTWHGNIFDVTEEMERERALKAAVDTAEYATGRLEHLAENVPGGIFEFVIDADGAMSFPYVTSGFGPLLGTTSDAVMQDATAAFQYIHPDDTDGLTAAIETSQETLGLFKHRYRVNHPVNGLRWIAVNSTPVARTEGGVIWYGSLFDVTDDVEREQALEDTADVAHETSSRLERLTENVPGGIFEFALHTDGEMSFPYLSLGFGGLVGRPTVEILADADAFFELVHPDDLERLHEIIANSAKTLESVKMVYRIRNPERGVRWLRVTATPFAQPEGGVLWYGSAFDVTEEVEREKALETTAEVARQTSSRLERLARNVPGGIWEFQIDAVGAMSFPYLSEGIGALLGVDLNVLREDGRAFFDFVHVDDLERTFEVISESQKTLEVAKSTFRFQHPERGVRWLRVTAMPTAQADGAVLWYANAFDATEEIERERDLEVAVETARAATARLEKLTQNVPGGLYEYRMEADDNGTIPYATQNMGPLLGTTTEALLKDAMAAFKLIHPEDSPKVMGAIMESRETLNLFDIRYRIQHPDRGLRWLQCKSTPVAQPDGAVVWYGSYLDVTEEVHREQELEAARKRMEVLSLIDSLTGLPNRRAYDEEMAARCGDKAGRRRNQAVIRIDLDHFKAVNDTLGHAAGDAVLCRVATILREVAGEGDFAARLGGDEFVILLAPGRSDEKANAVVEEVHARIKKPFAFEGRHCRFDASFGLAFAEQMPNDPAELLSFADAALFKAKGRGRGQVAVFTNDLHEYLIRSRRRAGEIHQALEREEFVPFFHPQIDAETGLISGFEVLARWERPGEGLVPPDEFIPVAEQMRVVKDIDRMMFAKAISVMDVLRDEGFVLPKLAFNVSAGRIHDPDIVNSVIKMRTLGTRIAFELLESILLEEEGAIIDHHIDILKEHGIEIEVDDFGSGHASIIGVLRVAPRALKIDRRLIAPLLESDGTRGLVRAIVDMGRSLKIDITAEGVETMDHAKVLREMGCQTLQGFAFARPMSANDLKEYLATFEPVFEQSQVKLAN
ncbi:PAS domain-containing protein [Cognatiyoonia sp. IB215182]|uniref:PAS domain-containing protein n=1 Tax=Cognatiyoonia sp. IB215182 TaxID=3097353 RepID=UPI002A1354B5|nr:PAS domain-containing protein [Cognatiyoonia sp. IB215182]MDX8355116.1 PAS domain-containing protein [Cognatiyoonia sp. IB215182]